MSNQNPSKGELGGRATLALDLNLVFILLAGLIILGLVLFSASQTSSLDSQLRSTLRHYGVEGIDIGPEQRPELVSLGQNLFFDKEISGNRDISCATCHHPSLAGADGRSLPIGTRGKGLGPEREMVMEREFIPRNAPEIFNRGSDEWVTMFWDGRIASDAYTFQTPAGTSLPEGLDNPLAAQAMFPPTSRDEMRGGLAETSHGGGLNEIGAVEDGDLENIWGNLTARLLAIPEYEEMFAAAYPDIPADEIGFQHAANALAAFEIDAFSFKDSPWELYLAGSNVSMSDEAKRGALLFYGDAGCAQCHSGNLMTDQQYHNIGVPNIGPGKVNEDGLDFGRFLESEAEEDRFAFRTPPLANVALTGPYMHNGAYHSLEDAVRHHLNPQAALMAYDESQLSPALMKMSQTDDATNNYVLETLDELVTEPTVLSDAQFSDLMAFLNALTAPNAVDMSYLVPPSVPSGLVVAD